jgi:hypothetical protein
MSLYFHPSFHQIAIRQNNAAYGYSKSDNKTTYLHLFTHLISSISPLQFHPSTFKNNYNYSIETLLPSTPSNIRVPPTRSSQPRPNSQSAEEEYSLLTRITRRTHRNTITPTPVAISLLPRLSIIVDLLFPCIRSFWYTCCP